MRSGVYWFSMATIGVGCYSRVFITQSPLARHGEANCERVVRTTLGMLCFVTQAHRSDDGATRLHRACDDSCWFRNRTVHRGDDNPELDAWFSGHPVPELVSTATRTRSCSTVRNDLTTHWVSRTAKRSTAVPLRI